MKQVEGLRQIMEMIVRSGIRPEMKPSDWLRALLFFHRKGWLYATVKDKEIKMALAAYRIKEFDEKTKNKVPDVEEGDILYIPFIISRDEDRFRVTRIAKTFLSNHKDIKEIVFEDKNNRVRRFTNKEFEDGKGKA